MIKLLKFTLFGVIFFCSTLVCAHPPKDIKITFAPKTKILTAVIYHDVLYPKFHYIKTVEVDINNKKAFESTFTQQDNPLTRTVNYKLSNIKSGDTVSVEAHCSLIGKLKKEIIIK